MGKNYQLLKLRFLFLVSSALRSLSNTEVLVFYGGRKTENV